MLQAAVSEEVPQTNVQAHEGTGLDVQPYGLLPELNDEAERELDAEAVALGIDLVEDASLAWDRQHSAARLPGMAASTGAHTAAATAAAVSRASSASLSSKPRLLSVAVAVSARLVHYVVLYKTDRVAFNAKGLQGIIADIIVTTGAAALGATLLLALKKAIEQVFESMGKLGEHQVASMASKFAPKGPIGAAVALVPAVLDSLQSCFWYLISWSPNLTPERRAAYRRHGAHGISWKRLLADAVLSLATWSLTGVVAAAVLPLGASATLGAAATMGIGFVLTALFESAKEAIVTRKNDRPGWLPWLWSFFDFSQGSRLREWQSMELLLMEGYITDKLICPITKSLVVDPVRYVGSSTSRPGHCHVYERAALFRHLRRNQRDPLTNEPATFDDYRPSPAGARSARRFATHFGAVLVNAEDS